MEALSRGRARLISCMKKNQDNSTHSVFFDFKCKTFISYLNQENGFNLSYLIPILETLNINFTKAIICIKTKGLKASLKVFHCYTFSYKSCFKSLLIVSVINHKSNHHYFGSRVIFCHFLSRKELNT